eukprot:scaffold111515_cov61-Phaeocystis_antarctica.AAC.3
MAASLGAPHMARSRSHRALLGFCKLCSWSLLLAQLPDTGRVQRRRTIEPPHRSVLPRSAVVPPQPMPSLPPLSGASCSQGATCCRRWRALRRSGPRKYTLCGGNKEGTITKEISSDR